MLCKRYLISLDQKDRVGLYEFILSLQFKIRVICKQVNIKHKLFSNKSSYITYLQLYEWISITHLKQEHYISKML